MKAFNIIKGEKILEMRIVWMGRIRTTVEHQRIIRIKKLFGTFDSTRRIAASA
jgi:hypothetical protein